VNQVQVLLAPKMEKEKCHLPIITVETPNVGMEHLFFPSSYLCFLHVLMVVHDILHFDYAILLHIECGSCGGAYFFGGLSICQ